MLSMVFNVGLRGSNSLNSSCKPVRQTLFCSFILSEKRAGIERLSEELGDIEELSEKCMLLSSLTP